jgi:hypothetical protein
MRRNAELSCAPHQGYGSSVAGGGDSGFASANGEIKALAGLEQTLGSALGGTSLLNRRESANPWRLHAVSTAVGRGA